MKIIEKIFFFALVCFILFSIRFLFLEHPLATIIGLAVIVGYAIWLINLINPKDH